MQFTTHQAKTQFSKLLAMMQQGEQVVITKGREKTPIAQLVPVKREGGIRLGLYKGISGPIASDEELISSIYTDEELDEFENNPL